MQIVLVDPSRAVRQIMTQLIEPGVHHVHAFSDGREALEYVAANDDVRALITSAEPASISGIQLCAAARRVVSARRPLYIILMSSLDDRDLVVRALDNGADDFIRKPPIAEELRARLRVADRVTSMQRALIQQATTDPLTGLLNRRAFFDQAAEACAQADAGTPLSAIIFDIDKFKCINDSYGHDTGDLVLTKIAALVREVQGITARLGGEEFCVLSQCELTDAIDMAESLKRSMRRLSVDRPGSFTISCSFGVAEWEKGDTIDRLLRRADIALYQAKETGRDRVVASDSFQITERHDEWRGVARTGKRHQ